MRAGIAIPVPGAAEIAALLDNADVGDPCFDQPRAGHEAGDAAADEGKRDVIEQRLAVDRFGVGIALVVRELAFEPQILRIAIRAQPLVALREVFREQRLLVDLAVHGRLIGHLESILHRILAVALQIVVRSCNILWPGAFDDGCAVGPGGLK